MASSSSNSSPPETTQPIYFWREHSSKYGYLSQWYPSPFTTPSTGPITFQTAEQYMMYRKAILFNDPENASAILETSIPAEQKALGRAVRGFDEKLWNKNRSVIVEEGNYWKFKNGKDEGELKGEGLSLRDRLLGTGERDLVEASPFDKIWGIGFAEKNAEKKRKHWGLNLLGKALVKVRERLRADPVEDKIEDDFVLVDGKHKS